jgi:hypothetical protein
VFEFNHAAGATDLSVWGMWLVVFGLLFGANEVSRRYKWVGFFCFLILPVGLSLMWFTVLSDTTYTDWFHLAKVYSSTAGCLGFWCIRHVQGKDRSGRTWRLADKRWALCFPPLILAINIAEAVARDVQVGVQYWGELSYLADEHMQVLGGPWNFMNAAAGVLNIVTITGWFGICLRQKTKADGSRDMLWPDMLWIWIIPYDLWNFAYTYNCLPGHAWYCGFALLLAPTLCNFTTGKGAWLQHRAHTLALWCMFAQTFPAFIDEGKFAVTASYSPAWFTAVSGAALASNVAILVYMVYQAKKTGRHPYKGDLYTDLKVYQQVKALAEVAPERDPELASV